jgi:hypothetical protein
MHKYSQLVANEQKIFDGKQIAFSAVVTNGHLHVKNELRQTLHPSQKSTQNGSKT